MGRKYLELNDHLIDSEVLREWRSLWKLEKVQAASLSLSALRSLSGSACPRSLCGASIWRRVDNSWSRAAPYEGQPRRYTSYSLQSEHAV